MVFVQRVALSLFSGQLPGTAFTIVSAVRFSVQYDREAYDSM